MPSNDRALYHITDPVTEITRGAPSSSEGSDGDKRFAYIPDRGLYHFVKHSGKWHSSAVYQEDISPLTKNGLQTENLTSKHDIRMAPARNVEIKEKKSMGTGEFTQGFTGNGWRLRHVDNEYNLEVDSMTVRGTLHVFEMLIQQLRATNGTVIIASAAKADSATSTTITFDDPSDHGVCPFAVNDIVMCQRVNLNSTTVVKRIVRRVTDVNGATITVVRDGDLPGDTATVVKGDDFVRIGNTTNTSRQGGVLLTADMTNAPFIEIFDNVSSWATWTATDKIKARLGQLKGITDADANLDDETKFGLYTNDVNLKGHLFSQSGEIAGWTLGNTTISKNNTELSSAGTLTLGTSSDIIKLSSIDSTYRIWAGHTSGASANFSVEKDGTLYATGATISGAITITGGNAETTTGSQTKATAAQVAATAAAATDATSKADAAEAAAEAAASSDATSKAAAAEAAAKAASLLRASYLTSNTTTINGGTITTGSIAADRIAANSITADQINTSNITAAVVTTTSVNATTITADAINMDTATVSGTLAAGNIDVSGVVTANAVNAVGISASSISTGTMTAGAINMASGKAQINADGSAVFTDVAVTGTLTSTAGSTFNAGTVGGWTVGASSISAADGRFTFHTAGANEAGNFYIEPTYADITGNSRRGIIWKEPKDSGGSSSDWWMAFHDTDNSWRLLYNGSNQFQVSSGGDITATGGTVIYGSGNSIQKRTTSGSGGLTVAMGASTGYFTPYYDADTSAYDYSLGSVNHRWYRLNANQTTNVGSDERDKTEITDSNLGLGFISSLRPITYKRSHRDSDIVSDNKSFGLIAQEVKTSLEASGVSDEMIWEYDSDADSYSMRYSELIMPMIKAIQELKAEVEQLKNSD